MEIGSFIELEFPRGRELFKGDENVARLNSGRAAIWHAQRTLGCETVWLPFYQCDTVRAFLLKKGAKIKYYHIDSDFNPVGLAPRSGEAVVLVNYYGVMSGARMAALAEKYADVIIDNSQAFFCPPVDGAMNVYSCRKFVGAPDGAYLIGPGAEKLVCGYPQGFSSDTALFLLMRHEYGCEGKTYERRMENERRIDSEDAMRMSALTRVIMDGADYDFIASKRRENFAAASKLFGGANRIDPLKYYDDSCVPMAYPLVIEDDGLLDRLLAAKHFQGHWWSYLLDEVERDSFEYWLSRYMIPVTIDQRCGRAELEYIGEVVLG